MSRREGRDSDSKRHRSRFDQQPSLKRSRRDGKPMTERPPNNNNLDGVDQSDQDQKHRRRLQDALPLEAPIALDPKLETGALNKETAKTTDGHREGAKHASNPNEVPRSRSYFQHDDRGKAGQVGRSFSRRTGTERGWRDSKDQQSERSTSRRTTNDEQQRDEKSRVRKDDNHAWRHDGYFEMEADPKPPSKKRPSFREKKIIPDPKDTDKAPVETTKPSHPDHPLVGNERREERREERGENNSRHSDRPEKPYARNGEAKRGEIQRGHFSSRDRYGGGGNYQARDGFTTRQGYRPTVRVEKWKHDLFDEANRSPTPKNEEDQIAKVEALLAS